MALSKKAQQAIEAAKAQAGVVPSKWTPGSHVDKSVKVRELVAAMFPNETLIKARARGRDAENPDRILAESYYLEGEIQPVWGLPFRVGKYARVKDAEGRDTAVVRGGTAPLTGYVPASLWNDARFEELTQADADGEP